jgi:hypothetical protein
MKWADLVKWSTMTHIESYPREVHSRPTMKFIHMSFHFHSGILKGCRFPAGLKWSALTLQQVSHLATYFVISRFILVHQIFSSSFDISYLFSDGYNISSNVFHPWSFDRDQNISEWLDSSWTITLHQHLHGNTLPHPITTFFWCDPTQRLFSPRWWHLTW